MIRCSILNMSAIIMLGLTLLSTSAVAQQKTLKEQLVGTWMIISTDGTRPDGTKFQPFGPNPKGILVLDGNGRTSFILVSSDRPKFASNNRNTGTADENKAAMKGGLAFFGTWSVDEADKSLITRIEGSTFPNWDGHELKRTITSLTDDELKYINPAVSVGGSAATVWRRVK
jgi:Lipocalin-like domain